MEELENIKISPVRYFNSIKLVVTTASDISGSWVESRDGVSLSPLVQDWLAIQPAVHKVTQMAPLQSCFVIKIPEQFRSEQKEIDPKIF